jgi:hypothetical protein
MTRQEIRDLTRKNLGETTAAFWTDVELNSYINLAGHEIAWATKCIRKNNGYITTTASASDYVLSNSISNCLSITSVRFKQDGTTWHRLTPKNPEELDEEYPGWLSAAAGTPIHYYYDIKEDNFSLWPKPNSTNAGTNYVRLWHTIDFTEITSDSKVPTDIPVVLHPAFAFWATHFGFVQRGYGDKGNDALKKYAVMLKGYLTEDRREKEDDDVVARNYKGL